MKMITLRKTSRLTPTLTPTLTSSLTSTLILKVPRIVLSLTAIAPYSILGAFLLSADSYAGLKLGLLTSVGNVPVSDRMVSTNGILFSVEKKTAGALIFQGAAAATILGCTGNGNEDHAPPSGDGKPTEDFIKAYCRPMTVQFEMAL